MPLFIFFKVLFCVPHYLLGAPEVIGDPMDQSSEKGACITLSCQARGEAPLFYQWYKDGINIPGKKVF